MSFADVATVVFCLAGAWFFTAGTLGLLRFPHLLARLHALTKADNLGLGLVVVGLCFQAPGPVVVAKLVLIWWLSLLAGSSMCFLLGRHQLDTRGSAANDPDRADDGAGDHDGRGEEGTGDEV